MIAPRAAHHDDFRVLFISPGPQPPHADPRKNALYHLSRHSHGDTMSIWWEPSRSEARRKTPDLERTLGRFRYRWSLSVRMPPVVRMLWQAAFYFVTGLRLSITSGRYDAIVAYAPFKTGLVGYALKLLTRTPLIIDLPVNPKRSFTFDRSFESRLKRRLADVFVPFLLRRADHVKLLFPEQIDAKEHGINSVSVFHDFVPISLIAEGQKPTDETDPYILSLGHPFPVKGVDVLIRAFLQIADRFPRVRLKVVGHCPDLTSYRELAGHHPRVEFLPGVPHDKAMDLVARSSVFVLASRTEGLARVLLEAMALRKPIVASAVDGTPFCLDYGRAGLLFQSENADDLARQLARVLEDPAYARRLADEGHASAMRRFSEEVYVEQFRQMLAVVARRPSRVIAPAQLGSGATS